MFRKLHLHLTIFCTIVTGGILLLLTAICLLFAEKNLKQNSYASFLSEINTTITHLQEQDYISHQWLNQLQESGHCSVFLFDGEAPLIYQQYHLSEKGLELSREVADAACDLYGMDLFTITGQKLTSHVEFDFRSRDKEDYYISAGIIPKNEGQLGFLLLYPLSGRRNQILHLRLAVLLADLFAVMLLAVFFWHFTFKMIIPLSETQKKQTRFIASASHELRAPLAVLRSGLESLAKTDQISEQRHFIRLLSDESSRLQKLADRMLLLAGSDSDSLPVQMTACQPDELLLTVYEKYELLAQEKKIALSLSLPEELLPDCHCDPSRMEQVFSILMDNALSYTPESGSIRLSLSYTGSRFQFIVSDTGCGIPDDQKEQIFERFYRADQARADREHFGLGLCIAKEIIKKHAGTIRVTDRPGGGSCFIIELPL